MAINKRRVRNLNRISKVVNILIQNGFESMVSATGLRSFLPNDRRFTSASNNPSESRWLRIRHVVEELGPTMIALANYLSYRPDILPEPLISEFAKISFADEPFGKTHAITIFEKVTGCKIKNVFSYFDSTCYFAEGFGRTFRAKLLTGQDVAVKVLNPDAIASIQTDLTLLRDVVSLIENYLVNHGIPNPKELVDNFEEMLIPELDLRNEANTISKFRKAYSKNGNIVVPQVFNAYTSEFTLVTEYFNAIEVKKNNEFVSWGVEARDTAEKFTKTMLTGMLETGVFHTSPRSTVVSVLPDGRISFLDYASTGILTTDQRLWVSDVAAALVARNSRILSESLRKLAVGGEIDDYQSFRTDIQYLADNLYYMEELQNYMQEFSLGIMRVAYRHKLMLPRNVVSAFTTLAAVEKVAVSIYSGFCIANHLKPFSKKLFIDRLSPDRIKSRFNQNLSQATDLLENSPLELSLILKKLRRGEFTANHKIVGMGFLIKKFDTAANKLVYAVIIAALVIGASIITVLGGDMYSILGFPIAALVGYTMALILSFSLLFYTIRNRFGSRGNNPDGE